MIIREANSTTVTGAHPPGDTGRRMNERQVPVTFRNRAGLRLFGILHEPVASAKPGVAFIMLSPGVKMRVGPERLYLRLTNLLVDLGIPVLRFDFHGLGDSEGALPERLLLDVYGQVQVGRFVDDTIDAMDWMQEKMGVNRFILSGLCGGAVTGLLAGARDRRVAGLLALGITPLIDSRTTDPSRYMTAGQLDRLGRKYVQKLFRPQSWLRLLTLRTDYRMLWRSMKKLLLGSKPPAQTPAVGLPANDNASPLFPPAFFEMLGTKRPMLLIFGGSDRLKWEFEEKFVARHTARLSDLPAGYQVHTIHQANHVLSFGPWQHEMLAVSKAWLQTHFAPDLTSRPAAT